MNTVSPEAPSQHPTPLREAIIDYDRASVSNLIKDGFDINRLDGEGSPSCSGHQLPPDTDHVDAERSRSGY